MLGNSADTLQPGAVRGMAQLASSAVKGLKSENVTITDSTGAVLWPSADGGAGAGGGSSSKASAEARYARQAESSVNAMLAATLGPGKAQVKVNADLNMDETTEKELTYAAKGTPLKTSEETEKLEGGAAAAGGTAGTGSNVPTYSARNGNGSANSNYERARRTPTTASTRRCATPRSPAARSTSSTSRCWSTSPSRRTVFNQLENTVGAAVGLDTARGDTISSAQMAFAKAETPKAGPVPTTLLEPLKWVGLGLAALLFLFFMTRGMRKRESENLTPAWLTEIEEPVSLAALEARTTPNYLDTAANDMLPPRVPDASLHQLDQLMEREPERVAAQVKAWMAED